VLTQDAPETNRASAINHAQDINQSILKSICRQFFDSFIRTKEFSGYSCLDSMHAFEPREPRVAAQRPCAPPPALTPSAQFLPTAQ
jgi:hypothetical protein